MLKKKIIKLFLIFGVVIISIALLGCEQTNIISANYIRTDFHNVEKKIGNRSIIYSTDELLYFIEDDKIDFGKLKKYNDKFFKDSALIIFISNENSIGNQTIINSYHIDNNLITINMETITSGDTYDDVYYYNILEVKKEEIIDISNMIVMKNNDKIIDGSIIYKTVNYKVLNYGEVVNKKNTLESLIITINNRDEYASFLNNNIISQIGGELDYKISDNYFNEKTIVSFLYPISDICSERKVKTVVIEGNKLIIKCAQVSSEICINMLTYVYLLEIDNNIINNTSYIELEIV